jgi:hypothetical protein
MDEKPGDREYANQYRDYAQRYSERLQQRIERRSFGGPCVRRSPTGGMLAGAIIILVGVLMLLDNFGLIHARDFWRYWPVVFVFAGVGKVLDSHGRPAGMLGGGLLIAVGTIWILNNTGIIIFDPRLIAPVILIAVGALLLVRTLEGSAPGLPFIQRPPGPQETTIAPWAIFGASKRVVTSKDFRGGDLFALFGGIELDLRNSDIKDQALIAATALFGGIDIRVPPTWLVETRGAGIFGGYEDKTVHPDPDRVASPPKLILDGLAIFGGVTIKN